MFIQLAIDLDILQQGVKQWGFYDKYDNAGTFNFPISFSNQCWTVICSSQYNNNAYATSWTKTAWSGDIRHGDIMKGGSWAAFGC